MTIKPSIPNAERVHHLYSPSSLQNLEACPCFQNRDSQHVAAVRGTMQHGVTETGKDDHRLSDDEALAAAECLDFYTRQKQLLEEARLRAMEVSGTEVPLAEVIDLSEAYLPIDDCEFEEFRSVEKPDEAGRMLRILEHRIVKATTAGYVDRALISHDRMNGILLDWKFGLWAVEDAQNNLQGISYALGLFKAYPTLDTIKFYFKMPHLDRMTEAMFTRAQVPELYLRVQTVVARAREARKGMLHDDFSMATPRVPACNFCFNLGRCPAVADFACKVGHKFYPLAIPADISPTGLKDPESTALGLRLAQVMGVWATAFRTQINERVIRGVAPVPEGFKLQTRQDREIVDTAKFRTVTLKWLTETELAAAASYTFGAVEDRIMENAPRGTKKNTVEEYQKALLDEGAVKKGDPYTFLKGVSS